MGRDDWKYDEEIWDGPGEEEEKKSRPEKQCPQCLHWHPLDATYCSWCGRVLDDPQRR